MNSNNFQTKFLSMRISLILLLCFSSCIFYRKKPAGVWKSAVLQPLTEMDFYAIKKDTLVVKAVWLSEDDYVSCRVDSRSHLVVQSNRYSWLAIILMDTSLKKTIKNDDKIMLTKTQYHSGSIRYHYYQPNNQPARYPYPDTLLAVEGKIKIL